MMGKNINFKLVSLNVRGTRSFEKRKAVLNWLYKSQTYICFLQETYSTPEVVNIWKKTMEGRYLFLTWQYSHSKGTMILVKEQLDFKLNSSTTDSLGRYIFLEVEIQDSPFVLLNIYAPNKCAEQCVFFSKLSEDLKDFVTDADRSIIVGGGGNFNVILNQDLDDRGGNKKDKDSVRYVEDMIIEHDLVDIWRIRNPTDTRFTLIQRRLDYWLTSNDLQEDVESVEIISAIRSDHSAITLSVNGLEENERGPSFWKFNCTLINDQEYCDLLRSEYKNWLEDFKGVNDKRVLWDLIKYKIRQRTIIYSKAKARKKREKTKQLGESLRNCTIKCDNNHSKVNLQELECLQAEYLTIILRNRVEYRLILKSDDIPRD